MKLKIALALCVLSSTAFGSTLAIESLQTFDGTGDTGFLLSSGAIVTTGAAQAGIFTTLTDLEVQTFAAAYDLVSLQAAFTGISQVDNFSTVPTNFGVSNAGLLSLASTGFIPVVGERLYTLVQSGAEWALFAHNTVLSADPPQPTPPNSVSATFSDGTVLVGSVGPSYIADFSALGGSATTTVANSIQLYAVPEPSAALLGALGAIGLLRRRRI